MTQMWVPAIAFTASPALVAAINTLAMINSLRLSIASASAPPRNEHKMIGITWPALSKPT